MLDYIPINNLILETDSPWQLNKSLVENEDFMLN
jgi:hypothetical protein